MTSEKESKAGKGIEVTAISASGTLPIPVHNGSGASEQAIPIVVPAGEYNISAYIVSPEEGSWDIIVTKLDGSHFKWEGKVIKYGDKVTIPNAPVELFQKNLYRIEVSWSEKSDTTCVIHYDI